MSAPPTLHARVGRIAEAALFRWGLWSSGRPILLVLLCLAATAWLGAALPSLRVETSDESFLRAGSTARVTYDAFRRDFERNDSVVVSVETQDPFDPAFLDRLVALHRAIEEQVPHVYEVTSLLNVRATRGEVDELIVEDLLEGWPLAAEELAAVRKHALANPLYRNWILSDDGNTTALVVLAETFVPMDSPSALAAGFGAPETGDGPEPRILSPEDNAAFVRGLGTVVRRFDAPDFPIRMAGTLVNTVEVNELLRRDVLRVTGLAVVGVAIVLFLILRSVTAVVLPLLVVGCVLVATHGIMARIGVPISAPLEILPSLLLTVGVCGVVHLQVAFRRVQPRTQGPREAVAKALGRAGVGVALASLTTALGLLSFSFAEVSYVRDLGLVAPLGVMLSLAYTMLMTPPLLVFLRPRAALRGEARDLRWLSVRIGGVGLRAPRAVLGAALVVVAVSAVGAARLRIGHDILAWLPEDAPLRIATEFVDRELRGVTGIEVLVDSGREAGLHDPAILARIEAAQRRAEELELGPLFVGRTHSIVDVLAEVNLALNGNDPAFRRIPASRELVAQELLILESAGSDAVEEATDASVRTARISMRAPWANARDYPPFVSLLEQEMRTALGPDLPMQVTGLITILARSISALMYSFAYSYVFAISAISVTMFLLIGSLRLGLLSMIPNLFPVVLTLGVMGWAGISLDGSTLLLGSIVLGLAVDDTIHFLHGYRIEREAGRRPEQAIRETLSTTGVAMLTTSLVLATGFLSFTAAYLQNANHFGILAAFACVAALLADVLLAPALLVLAEGEARRPAPGFESLPARQ